MEVTEALRRYAEEKLSRLQKYLDHIVAAHVVLSIEKHRQIAEATLYVRSLTIRAEESTADLYSSVDLVLEKLERQILRHKERIVAHPARRGRESVRQARPEGGAAKATELVRTKRFPLEPLPVDEAILQMELLGHSFYVFRNAGTNDVNVLYRRRDGTYGLIEPEG